MLTMKQDLVGQFLKLILEIHMHQAPLFGICNIPTQNLCLFMLCKFGNPCISVLGGIEDLYGPARRDQRGPVGEVDPGEGGAGRGHDGTHEDPGGHRGGLHAPGTVPSSHQEVHTGRK